MMRVIGYVDAVPILAEDALIESEVEKSRVERVRLESPFRVI